MLDFELERMEAKEVAGAKERKRQEEIIEKEKKANEKNWK